MLINLKLVDAAGWQRSLEAAVEVAAGIEVAAGKRIDSKQT